MAVFLFLKLQLVLFLSHLVSHLIVANQGLLVFIVDGILHLDAFFQIADGTLWV